MTSLGSFGAGLSLAAATIALRNQHKPATRILQTMGSIMGLRDLEPSTRCLSERLFQTEFKKVRVPMLHGLRGKECPRCCGVNALAAVSTILFVAGLLLGLG
jgi:hypothetical protein